MSLQLFEEKQTFIIQSLQNIKALRAQTSSQVQYSLNQFVHEHK